MIINLEQNGFVIRATQQNCEVINKNTYSLKYTYLQNFNEYFIDNKNTLLDSTWTACGYSAQIFTDRVKAIKIMKLLQKEAAQYNSNVKYQVLTYKFACRQEIK